MRRVLIVDNYDSFTYNLAQLVGGLGATVVVRRNDAVTLTEIDALAPSHIILSPGPGHPANARDFGICADIVRESQRPILGVCLGHQGIAHHLGGAVVKAPAIVHGKTSAITHDGTSVFAGLPARIEVMRYHSWMVDAACVPAELRVTAQTDDGIIMGLCHVSRPVHGIQFHPESFATPAGEQLLSTFLESAP